MKSIAIIPYAGLGNRMRAIASGIYISQQLNTKATIYWNKTTDCYANFSDLFKPIILKNVCLEENHSFLFKLPRKQNLYLPKLFQKVVFDQCVYNFNKNKNGNIFDTINTKTSKILFLTCHSMANHYDLQKIFKPNERLETEIKKITSQFSGDTIGIHIRRTDNINSIKLSSNEAFKNRIDYEIKKNPNVRFYLASDNLSIKEEFVQQYKERIITYHNLTNRNTLDGMIFAASELFCLSKTKKIIGSAYSSYSEIAAELGGIKLEIAY